MKRQGLSILLLVLIIVSPVFGQKTQRLNGLLDGSMAYVYKGESVDTVRIGKWSNNQDQGYLLHNSNRLIASGLYVLNSEDREKDIGLFANLPDSLKNSHQVAMEEFISYSFDQPDSMVIRDTSGKLFRSNKVGSYLHIKPTFIPQIEPREFEFTSGKDAVAYVNGKKRSVKFSYKYIQKYEEAYRGRFLRYTATFQSGEKIHILPVKGSKYVVWGEPGIIDEVTLDSIQVMNTLDNHHIYRKNNDGTFSMATKEYQMFESVNGVKDLASGFFNRELRVTNAFFKGTLRNRLLGVMLEERSDQAGDEFLSGSMFVRGGVIKRGFSTDNVRFGGSANFMPWNIFGSYEVSIKGRDYDWDGNMRYKPNFGEKISFLIGYVAYPAILYATEVEAKEYYYAQLVCFAPNTLTGFITRSLYQKIFGSGHKKQFEDHIYLQ
jgi:hypothetical protein